MGRSRTRQRALASALERAGSLEQGVLSAESAESAEGNTQGQSWTPDASAVSFGKALAAHDRPTRDRAVAKVSKFLGNAADKSPADLAQIWEGLYFCMYHCDRVPVQQELAVSLAALIHRVRPVHRALDFSAAAMRIFQNHWHGVDRLRQDKFYSLIRRVVRETFVLLRGQGWALTEVVRFAETLQICPLQAKQVRGVPGTIPMPGLQFHLADLFWDELFQASPRGSVPGEVILALLRPWASLLSQSPELSLRKRIMKEVFRPLLFDWVRGEADADAEPEDQPIMSEPGATLEDGGRASQWLPTPLIEIVAMLKAHAMSEDLCIDAARSSVYSLIRDFERTEHELGTDRLAVLANFQGLTVGSAGGEGAENGLQHQQQQQQQQQQSSPGNSARKRKAEKKAKSPSEDSSVIVEGGNAKRHKVSKSSSSPAASSGQKSQAAHKGRLQFDLMRNETREFDELLSPQTVGVKRRGKGSKKSSRRNSAPAGILKAAVPLSEGSPWNTLHTKVRARKSELGLFD